MNQVDFKSAHPDVGAGPVRPGFNVHQALFVAFLLNLLLVALKLGLSGWLAGLSQVPETLLVILGIATTLSSLGRALPAQNVVLAAVLIAALSFGADLLSAAIGLPLAQRPSEDVPGRHFVWAMPVIRVFEILNSRVVAQRLVHRRPPAHDRGFWVLALTVVLAVLFESNLHTFAAVVGGYWSWNPAGTANPGDGIPWAAMVAWAFCALVITALITPWLISKRPLPIRPGLSGPRNAPTGPTELREPSDSSSSSLSSLPSKSGLFQQLEEEHDRKPPPPGSWTQLWAWISANLLFLAGAASRGVWPFAALMGIELVFLLALILHSPRPEAGRLTIRGDAPASSDTQKH